MDEVPRLHFVDQSSDVIRVLKKRFGSDFRYTVSKIEDQLCSGDTLIVPGNSFGIMDSGVALSIVNRWPDIQKKVQTKIQENWPAGLPVGAAIAVDLIPGVVLVYAPTMVMHGDIRGTLSVFMAMSAALRLRPQTSRFICPGMGTGDELLSIASAATQMYNAWRGHPVPSTWHEVAPLLYY